MSEAAHVPFTETKAPESAERLHRGALGLDRHLRVDDGEHRPGLQLLLRLRADRDRGGPRRAAGHPRRRRRHRAARQHAVAVLPGAAVDRRLHHLRGQDVRRHQRGDHRAGVRGRLHHRDLVGAGHLRRVPVDHAAVLPGQEYPLDHLLRPLHRRRHGHDVPRRGRVHQAGRLLLRLRVAGAAGRVDRRADQERRPPQLRRRSSPATSPTTSAAWPSPSRWPSTCSSAGRTRRRWPRRPPTRGATCPGPCSCRSPSWPSRTCWWPTPRSPASTTTPRRSPPPSSRSSPSPTAWRPGWPSSRTWPG